MHLPKSTFDRIVKIEDQPSRDVRTFIRTPESVVQVFFEGPQPLVQEALKQLEEAGIPADRREEYKQAAISFFKAPSHLRIAGELSFRPQLIHFGPDIGFSEVRETLPDLLTGSPLKPHLKGEPEALTVAPIDGRAMLNRFRERARPAKKVTSGERFLGQINRLMYALHEPIHILQGLSHGDAMNRLLEGIDGRNVVDEQKLQLLLMGDVFMIDLKKEMIDPTLWTKSVIGLPANWDGLEPVERQIFALSQFEAATDLLSERVVAEYIRKQPALLLWAHNTLSALVESLRVLREDMRQQTEEELKASVTLAKDIGGALGTIAPVYFSVFKESSDCLPALQVLSTEPNVLNRYLTGSVVHIEPFTRTDLENLLTDCEILGRRASASKSEWNFPLSEKRFLANERILPITDKGAELAAQVAVAAEQRGKAYPELQAAFDRLQAVLNRASTHDIQLELEAIQSDWQSAFGIALSTDQLKELYGIKGHLQAQLYNGYTKSYIVRKALTKGLEAAGRAPNHVLRQAFISFIPEKDSLELAADLRRSIGFSESEPVPKEDVLANQSLGIFSLNVPRLSAEKRRQLEGWVEAIAQKNMNNEDYITMLQKMANWKRLQNIEEQAGEIPAPVADAA